MEDGFDYGYTVISTDGGKTYKTLKNANTKEAKPPAQKGDGLTGSAPLPTPQTFDLSAYKGQAVVLGFRYVSDPLVNLGGWYIDDVKVGNQLISDGSSRAPFKSFTQLSPTQVKNWSVQIVGLDENRKRVHVERVDGKFDFTLTPAQVKTFAAFPVVVAIVGFDEITETVRTYAPYALKINGITQFGGVS
jgi:bacillopeptidase F (M6 metalloprotease family)